MWITWWKQLKRNGIDLGNVMSEVIVNWFHQQRGAWQRSVLHRLQSDLNYKHEVRETKGRQEWNSPKLFSIGDVSKSMVVGDATFVGPRTGGNEGIPDCGPSCSSATRHTGPVFQNASYILNRSRDSVIRDPDIIRQARGISKLVDGNTDKGK